MGSPCSISQPDAFLQADQINHPPLERTMRIITSTILKLAATITLSSIQACGVASDQNNLSSFDSRSLRVTGKARLYEAGGEQRIQLDVFNLTNQAVSS